jgi:hypothetical protein
MKRFAILFLAGAVAGTLYDWIHVAFGVLSYSAPHFAGTSLWVPFEFGSAAAVGAIFVDRLDRRLPAPEVGFARLGVDAALLLAAYLATGFFVGRNALTFALLAPLAVVSVATRPGRFVFVAAAVAAAVGPVAEALISRLGFFHYAFGDPVPYWLPLLWVVASGAFVDVALLSRGTRIAPATRS